MISKRIRLSWRSLSEMYQVGRCEDVSGESTKIICQKKPIPKDPFAVLSERDGQCDPILWHGDGMKRHWRDYQSYSIGRVGGILRVRSCCCSIGGLWFSSTTTTTTTLSCFGPKIIDNFFVGCKHWETRLTLIKGNQGIRNYHPNVPSMVKNWPNNNL